MTSIPSAFRAPLASRLVKRLLGAGCNRYLRDGSTAFGSSVRSASSLADCPFEGAGESRVMSIRAGDAPRVRSITSGVGDRFFFERGAMAPGGRGRLGGMWGDLVSVHIFFAFTRIPTQSRHVSSSSSFRCSPLTAAALALSSPVAPPSASPVPPSLPPQPPGGAGRRNPRA